jgi:hypothetical protein
MFEVDMETRSKPHLIDAVLSEGGDSILIQNMSRFGVANTLIVLFGLYMISTLLQGLFGELQIGRSIGLLIVVTLLYWWGTSFRSRKEFIIAAALFLVFAVNIPKVENIGSELTDVVYLLTTLLLLCYIAEKSAINDLYRSIYQLSTFLYFVAACSITVLLFSIVTHTGYDATWGGGEYFRGFCNNEHTMASVCCMLLGLLLLLGKARHLSWMSFFASLVPLYAIMETGARTYLIPASIIVLLFVNSLTNRRWFRVLAIALVVLVVFISFGQSSMGSKFEFTNANVLADSVLSAVTNGRNEIWINDFGYWASSGLDGIVFGNSFSSVYQINLSSFGLEIWAHNDFIMVVCGLGIVGFAVYCSAIVHMLSNLCRTMSRGYWILLYVYFFLPAILNGLFTYQHLMYSFVFLVTYCAAIDHQGLEIESNRNKRLISLTDSEG